MHDPMDRDHVPQHASWGGYPASDEKPDASPDVNYMNPNGKGKGDWNTKGGNGFITQSSSPIMLAMKSMMMAMEAMTGGGKGPHTPGGPDSGNGGQEGGKARGRKSSRCYNCSTEGHVARNRPNPKI